MTTAIRIFMWGVVASYVLTFAGLLVVTSVDISDRSIEPLQGTAFVGGLMSVFGLIFFVLLFLGCAILWWVWTFGVRRTVGPDERWVHSKAGLFWWWFVPFASWWMPRQTHLELFTKATFGEDDPNSGSSLFNDPTVRPVEYFVNQWWVWWVASSIFSAALAVSTFFVEPIVYKALIGAHILLFGMAAVKATQLLGHVEGRLQPVR